MIALLSSISVSAQESWSEAGQWSGVETRHGYPAKGGSAAAACSGVYQNMIAVSKPGEVITLESADPCRIGYGKPVYKYFNVSVVMSCPSMNGTSAQPAGSKKAQLSTSGSTCTYTCPAGYDKAKGSSGPWCEMKIEPCPEPPLELPSSPVGRQLREAALAKQKLVLSDQLTHGAKKAWADLQGELEKSGVTPRMTSAYRPTDYQRYLYDLTEKLKKFNDPKNMPTAPQCAGLKAEVEKEYEAQGLNGVIAAPGSSRHETGNAFDFVPSGGMTLGQAATIAKKIFPPPNFYVRQEKNAVHIEIRK